MADYITICGIKYPKNQVQDIKVLNDNRYEVLLHNGTWFRYSKQIDNGEERYIFGTTTVDENNKPIRTNTKITNCENISIFQSEENEELQDIITLNNTKALIIDTINNTFSPKEKDILRLNGSSYKYIINDDISIFEN